MRKYFNIAILVLTVSLSFSSCSDDDDSHTSTGVYIPKEVTVSDLGTADKPAAWGNEIMISGDGFSNATELCLIPVQSNIDPDKGLELEIVERNSGFIKFLAPLSSGGGEYELLQLEGDQVYSLGSIFLKNEKYPARLVGSMMNSEWGVSASYMDFEYEKGRLMAIKQYSVSDQFDFPGSCFSFIYDGDQLSSVTITQGDFLVKTYSFEYKGNTVLALNDDGSLVTTQTLTLNNEGAMTKRVDEWEQTFFDWIPGETEDDDWIMVEKNISYKDVYDYTYDAKGNMIEYIQQKFENGESAGDSFMRLVYDSKNALLPHLIPAWFWSISSTDNIFNCTMGYANNVVSYTIPSNGGGPLRSADEMVWNYALEYDKDGYPIYIYNLYEMPDGSIDRIKVYDVIYN